MIKCCPSRAYIYNNHVIFLYFIIYTEPENVDIILLNDNNLHLLNGAAQQMQQSQIAPVRNHGNDQIVSNNNVNNTQRYC